MRIRKNAPSLASTSTAAAPSSSANPIRERQLVCELNRSPWDVIDFSSKSNLSSQLEYLVETKSHVSINTHGEESASTSESIGLPNKKRRVKKEEEENIFYWWSDVESEKDDVRRCITHDGKGWRCKKEAKQGNSMCEHHLTKLKPKSKPTRRRYRLRASSCLPNNIYYYSGFGPWRGKRRGAGNDDSIIAAQASSSSSHGHVCDNHNGNVDIVVDHDVVNTVVDQDFDTSDGEGGKRKGRPIKARSLKSLL